MGQARNRGTRDERVKQAQTRPEKSQPIMVSVKDIPTVNLIRRFSKTIMNTPEALLMRTEIHNRKIAGDPMCIQFVKDIPKLKARSSARAQSNVNMWIVDYQRGM